MACGRACWVEYEFCVHPRAGLSITQQQQFLRALRSDWYSEGDYIVHEGEIGDRFFIITQGEVVVTRKLASGTEEAITHLYEGHFFGETSLVKNEPRNASVKVVSTTLNLMSIGKEVFQPFLDKEPGFRRFIDELVAKKEETSKRRQQVAVIPSDDTETLQRNEVRFSVPLIYSRLKYVGSAGLSCAYVLPPLPQVKVSIVRRRAKTKSFKTIINNYVFLEKIGQGAFGQVFLARSVNDSKLYAVKHIDRALLRKKRFSAKSDKVRELAASSCMHLRASLG